MVPISDSCAYREFYLAVSRTRPLSVHARDFCRFMLNDAVQSGALKQMPFHI